MYKYGMRLRGFSIGCQPMNGLVERIDDTTGKYHDIIIYDRVLTDKELHDYELDYIGEFLVHIADWNTGEDYRTFQTEGEAMEWIRLNCEDMGEDGIFYCGNRVEMY